MLTTHIGAQCATAPTLCPASDETGDAKFFAYDAQAKLIVGKDCEAIMNPLDQASGLPQRLQNIISKKYVFSVDLSDDQVRKYVVKAVLQRSSNRPAHPVSLALVPCSDPQPTQLNQLTQAGTSAGTAATPESQHDILRIETVPQMTPAPSDDADQVSPEDAEKRPVPVLKKFLLLLPRQTTHL